MIRVTDPALSTVIVSFHRGLMASHMPPDGLVEPGRLLVAVWDGEDAWRATGELTFITREATWTVTADGVERWFPLRNGGMEVTRWSRGDEVARYVVLVG